MFRKFRSLVTVITRGRGPLRFDASRRDLVRLGALGAGSLALGSAFTAPSCGPGKNLSAWVQTIVGAFAEMKPLLSTLGLQQAIIAKVSAALDKGAQIAKDFDAAYTAGKFKDASSLFLSLGQVITQIAADLSLANNRIVTIALAAVGVARIAIAQLLHDQATTQPQAMALVRAAQLNAGSDEAKAINEINRLANADVAKILAAVKF
jgi:hypothetical protein